MSDSFSVTLVSNRGTEIFSHNNNFHFSNPLPRTKDIRGYEVALESIYLADNYKGDQDDNRVAEIPQGFFNIEENENEIFIDKTTHAGLRVDKKTDNFTNFLSHLQISLRKVNMPVTITPFFIHGVPTSIELTYSATGSNTGFQFYMDQVLSEILGFTDHFFDFGTYTNDKPINLELFKATPIKDGISNCMLVKIDRIAVEMDQIIGKPDWPDFVVLLRYKLEEHGVDGAFHVKKSLSVLEYEISPITCRVQLSKFLNNYMGLDDDFGFIDKGSIRIPTNIIYPNQPNLLNVAKKSCSKLLVLCDIINPQVFAGVEMKLLALIDRDKSETGTIIKLRSNPLIYKSLCGSNISQITISIRDDNNDPIQFHEKPTVVTLNFRKI